MSVSICGDNLNIVYSQLLNSHCMVTKVVIIGQSTVIRLCTARAVGAAGYSVDIVRIGRKRGRFFKAPDYFCKFVDNYLYFDETGDISLPDFLVEHYKGFYQKPVIITLDDKGTHLVDENRFLLNNYFLFAHLRNDGSLSALMDKHFMKQQAESVGLSVVKGWPIFYDGGDFTIPQEVKYPCYVKGLYSYWSSKRIQRKCNNRTELVELLQVCKSKYPYSLYAEEYVDIQKEVGIMGISDGKNCIIPAETELVVMAEGSSRGVSILGRVRPIDNESDLKRKIEKLLHLLGYVGIFNIDLITTNESIVFVELNLRFATYGYGICKAGINFPQIFIGLLNNELELNPYDNIEKELYYFNEEVAFCDIIERKLGLKRYKEIKNHADIRFVYSVDDPRPMNRLRIEFVFRFLLMLIKRAGG